MGTSDDSVGLRSPIDRGYKLVVLSNSRRRGFSDDEVGEGKEWNSPRSTCARVASQIQSDQRFVLHSY